MRKCPCTEHCEKRSASCHGTCEEYILYEREKHASYAVQAVFRDYCCSEKKEKQILKSKKQKR